MKEKIKLEINESYIKSMVEKLKSRGVKSQENAKTILYSLGYLDRLKKDENVREFCDLEIDTNDEDLAVFNRVVELLGQRELPEARFRVKSELLYIESIMNSLKQCGKRAKNREDREKAKALYEKLTEIQKELKKRLKQLELKLKPQELKAEAKEFVSKTKEKISSKVNKDSVKNVTITALASAMLLMMSCGGGEKDENTMPLEPPTIEESAPGWSNMYPSASNTNNNETTSAESEVGTSEEAETTEPAETETKKPSGASETETAPAERDTDVVTKPTKPAETERESETTHKDNGEGDGLFSKGDGKETTSEEAETTEPAETETKKPSGAGENETAPLESDTEVETKPEDPGEDDGFFKI